MVAMTGPARTMVLTAPGVNCDRETEEACRLAGADVEAVHIEQLLSGERHILDFGFLVLPGGFSYGDHLGAGAMLATILRHRFLDDLTRFVAEGRPLLGICNGFQVLARLGFLGRVALMPNTTQRFECRWVPLHLVPTGCLFLEGLEDFELPVAHGQGRVVVPAESVWDVLSRSPLRYAEEVNGSTARIAAVTNEGGNVLGLMPHPERAIHVLQHPRRHREPDVPVAGLALFRNAVRAVKERV